MQTENFFYNKSALIISPHIDDETYGCGGTIARIKNEGGMVYIIVVSTGDLPHYKNSLKVTSGKARKNELLKIINFLKVDDYEILFDDTENYMKLDYLPQKELIELFDNKCKLAINKIKPNFLFIPEKSSNQDHKAVFSAAFASCRPANPKDKFSPPFVCVYEQPHSFWSEKKFIPNFYVDISNFLNKKISALKFYKSQIPTHPHPACFEGVKELAQLRGREVFTSAAEGFLMLRGKV